MGHQTFIRPPIGHRRQTTCPRQAPIIAIDGPAGTGKSTMALRLAQHFGWRYIDSGAMYRAVALGAAEQGIAWSDEAALARLCARLTFELPICDGQLAIYVDG